MVCTSSEIAVSVGPLTVRWYGLIMVAAIIAGYAVAHVRVTRARQDPEHLTNILFYGLIAAFFGARLYYVLFNLRDYLAQPAEVLAIWHGGLAIHGGLIGAVGATIVYSRRRGLDFWRWADLIAPGLILGQAIGRWGNFMNQEAFGAPTNLPWAIFIQPDKRPVEFLSHSYFHPTFLYESLWNLAGFALLIYLSGLQAQKDRAWPTGSLFLIYGIYYSFGRFFIEGLRTDSLMLGPLRVAQAVSMIVFFGSALWLRRRWKARGTVGGGKRIGGQACA